MKVVSRNKQIFDLKRQLNMYVTNELSYITHLWDMLQDIITNFTGLLQ